MKILIIEDDLTSARILSKTLEVIISGAVDITHCSNLGDGVEAIKAADGRFDLVLLDLKLPDSPDWEATYNAVAPHATKTPVIVITGNDDKEIAHQLLQKGIEDFITKGSTRHYADSLKETIEFALHRHKARKEMADTLEKDEQCIHWLTGGYSVAPARSGPLDKPEP